MNERWEHVSNARTSDTNIQFSVRRHNGGDAMLPRRPIHMRAAACTWMLGDERGATSDILKQWRCKGEAHTHTHVCAHCVSQTTATRRAHNTDMMSRHPSMCVQCVGGRGHRRSSRDVWHGGSCDLLEARNAYQRGNHRCCATALCVCVRALVGCGHTPHLAEHGEVTDTPTTYRH